MIPIYKPNIENHCEHAIEAIRSGWISNHGEYVKKSEEKLQEILNVKHAIVMVNGTAATHCLFLALKFKYPHIKTIYVSNNCYVAAWNAALMTYDKSSLKVMKMDINTFNISTDDLNLLEQNSAVFIVHNLGNIINVPKMKRMRPDLIFIEDNCEGLFGKYENVFSGTESLCSSCSFYGNKILTSGEGGAFFTNHTDIYNYIRSVYSQGMSDKRYIHIHHAFNYRMTNIEAAFLYSQLNDINNILHKKRKVFELYECFFGKNNEPDTQRADWMYGVYLDFNINYNQNDTFNFFKKYNVETRPFFYPINSHEHLKDIAFNDDNAQNLSQKVLMIPSSSTITEEEQLQVVNALLEFEKNIKNFEFNWSDIHINAMNDDRHFRFFKNRPTFDISTLYYKFMITKENEFIGYGHIDKDENEIYWIGIFVNKNYRNQKVGHFIMRKLIYKALLQNIHTLRLCVDNDNKNAIHLYKKFGFKKENDILNYYTWKSKFHSEK
jgi:perosamine synthetase